MKAGVVATAILALASTVSPGALAQKMTRDQCASASEDGQLAKVKGQLHTAREKFLACSDKVCPKLVRQDCSAAVEEVEKAMPSVVFAAHDADGKDLTDVKVYVDGTELVTTLDGKAVGVDPGPHTFRFESAGLPAREENIVVREGEKSRVVSATLGEPKKEKGKTEKREPRKLGARGSKTPSGATWIVGGIGAAALVGAGVVGFVALNKRSSLYDRCGKAGTCEQSEVDSVYRLYNISYVGAGIGGALLATSVVLYFTTSKSEEHPEDSALLVAPTLGGVNVAGHF